jgi:hypothetical protein
MRASEADRTASLRQELAVEHGSKARQRRAQAAGGSADTARGSTVSPDQHRSKPRVLVDPSKLVVANAEGQLGGATGSAGPARRNKKTTRLVDADRNVLPPRSTKAPPTFTPIDKESVGMALALQVLGSDTNEIVDLRNQRGVGADAVDSLGRFFDLKAYLGETPPFSSDESGTLRRCAVGGRSPLVTKTVVDLVLWDYWQ